MNAGRTSASTTTTTTSSNEGPLSSVGPSQLLPHVSSSTVNKLMDAIHWPIYAFSLVGAISAVVQHGFNAHQALRPLSPSAFSSDGHLLPAVEFWGGGSFACMTLGMVATHFAALLSGSGEARRAALLGSATMFLSMSWLWYMRGSTVRNEDPRVVALVDLALGIMFLVGAVTATSSSPWVTGSSGSPSSLSPSSIKDSLSNMHWNREEMMERPRQWVGYAQTKGQELKDNIVQSAKSAAHAAGMDSGEPTHRRQPVPVSATQAGSSMSGAGSGADFGEARKSR